MISKFFENERRNTTPVKPSRMRIAAYAAGAKLRHEERRMLLSNKKLTTEEKVEKSKEYVNELTRLRNRIKAVQSSKRKLDKEIDDERAKEDLLNKQSLGESFVKKVKEKLPQHKYEEIMDFMFMHEDCVEFIVEVVDKYKQEQKAAEKAAKEKAAAEGNGEVAESVSADDSDNMGEDTETAPMDETACSDEGGISA